MTTHTVARTATGHAPAVRYRDHTVTGTPDQLARLIAHHATAGTLVAATAPRPLVDGRSRIALRLRDTAPANTSATTAPRPIRVTRRPRRAGRIAALALTATGVITGLLAAVAYLLGQLVEFITAHAAAIAGIGIALAVLAALAARTRRHCPGC